MHGRPRKSPKPEDAAASAAKAQNLRSLQSQLLANHHNHIYTTESLEVSAKLLEINPESYTAWNYRKLAVEHYLSQSESDPDSVKSIVNEELRVVETALRQNFKSYGAWHHRKWVLSKGYSSTDQELHLIDRFQKADPRNFHAWNYRRYVTALMNRSEEGELKYTEQMIGNNFSNYSAWHNRSVLLSNLLKRKVQGYFPKEETLEQEYEHVHQAIFTDPDDQSGWFYHLWLLDQTVKTEAPVLVSSWPSHGSNVILQGNRYLDVRDLSPFSSIISDTVTLPVVLYFNQAIDGVNSSTVSVESELSINKDLFWKPLSPNNSKPSQIWVTYLDLANAKLHSLEAYYVEIKLGHSHGLMSTSGSHYTHPSQFTFKVCINAAEAEPVKGGKMISWRDENYQGCETLRQESDPVDQVTNEDDHMPTASNWRAKTIANEITLFRELLSFNDYKIGKLMLARLLTAHDSVLSPFANKMVHADEVLELYSDLMKSDLWHSQYYKDEHSLILVQKVTSSMESLLRHCYRDATESACGSVCLRLNNLSLSRMGSFEKLLWVQVLDLSHNELRSTEGLEAMQLLSCLNLSNNKLGSFTSLGPLRLLKSLKVLNISYNEIGLHSIDTTRYLCSSPLSHTEEIDSDHDDILSTSVDTTNYWEAFLIFKGLGLTQLDIMGNAVADEKFKSFLFKVLPTMKWLDGAELP